MIATILSISEHFDIALLSIMSEKPLPTLPIGDSSAVKISDKLSFIGHPAIFGVVHKFREVSMSVEAIDDNRGTISVTDGLFPGNSGGPAINSEGQVIGIALGKSSEVQESYILPILFARHFLESCGIWIDQGRVASYGSELELIKSKLATYNAMHTFLITDLKWDAEIFTEKKVDLTRSKSPQVIRSLRIRYEKRFPEQLKPQRVRVKLFPVASGGFDKDNALQNNLFVPHVIDLPDTDTLVIGDLDSAIKGVIDSYNEKSPTVPFDSKEIRTLTVDIVPEGAGIPEGAAVRFSKASLSLSYQPK
jgi:hypothetical protein